MNPFENAEKIIEAALFCAAEPLSVDKLSHLFEELSRPSLGDIRTWLSNIKIFYAERGIELVEYYCGISHLLMGSQSCDVTSGMDCHTIRQPLGVCVGISPFNFPVMIPMWLMIPAIACGNTFVLKPSEKDPGATLMCMELLKQAGLPPGVANVLQGGRDVVSQLITHPAVKAVNAVGSTAVVKQIYAQAIASGKRSQTFGGAKNHAVVMPHANIYFFS